MIFYHIEGVGKGLSVLRACTNDCVMLEGVGLTLVYFLLSTESRCVMVARTPDRECF